MELLLALSILSFVLLAIASLLFALFSSSSKNLSTTAARTVAEDYLEELIAEEKYLPLPAEDSVEFYSLEPETRTRFYRRVNVEPVVKDTVEGYTGGYYVEVEVWWDVTGPEQARAGRGRLATSVGRFHYPEGKVVD